MNMQQMTLQKRVLTERTCGWIIGLGVAGIGIYAMITAPERLALARQISAEQLSEEDRDYCAKFHMPKGTPDFAMCSGLLVEVRSRQAERSAREAAGIL